MLMRIALRGENSYEKSSVIDGWVVGGCGAEHPFCSRMRKPKQSNPVNLVNPVKKTSRVMSLLLARGREQLLPRTVKPLLKPHKGCQQDIDFPGFYLLKRSDM